MTEPPPTRGERLGLAAAPDVAGVEDHPHGPGLPSFLSQSAGVVAAKVAGASAGLAFNVVLARILGPELAGVFFLAVMVATVATVIGRGGLDTALLRFSAIAESRADDVELAGLRRRARTLGMAMSVAAGVVVLLSAEWIATSIFAEPRLTPALRIIAVSVPLGAAAALDLEFLKGIGRARSAAMLESLPGPLIGVALLAALALPYGLRGAAAAHVVTAAAVAGMLAHKVRRLKPAVRDRTAGFDTGRLIRTAIPLLWVAAMGLVTGLVDTAMLGIMADSRAVGVYGVAARVATLTSFVLHSVNMVAAPRFAALHSAGRHGELQRVARITTSAATALGLPVVLACVLFPTLIMRLFGPGFAGGATALTVLALGHLANVATGPVGFLLMMTGHERLMRNAMVVAAVANVGLNVWLIPQLGVLGAAIGTAASLAGMNLACAWLVRRRLGIHAFPLVPGVGWRA